jgi:hypothetical protein
LLKPLFDDIQSTVIGWRSVPDSSVLVGTYSAARLVKVATSSQEEKMLERVGLVLLAGVLAFAFAPYFYALGGL